MTHKMSPLISIEYFASLIAGGALASAYIGGIAATLIGAVVGAAAFFGLSMTLLIVPVSAGLWGYGIWFIVDFITRGNQGISIILALIAAIVAALSHLNFLGEGQGRRPPGEVRTSNTAGYSDHTQYVDSDGREYDKDGNEVV